MRTTIAILLSCSSFEEFFGDVLSLSVEDYLRQYRNDFSWYYMDMFRQVGLRSILYIPSSKASGLHKTEDGFEVRFLPIASYSKVLSDMGIWRGRLGRYITGVVNTRAFLGPLREAIKADRVDVLYEQEYWHARFDVLTREFEGKVPIIAADHGGVKRENFNFFKKRSFKIATALTAQSAEEAALVNEYGVTAMVMPNPVDTDYYSVAPAEKQHGDGSVKRILTVARLTNRQKRTSDLIEAMNHLDESWHLTIVGDGPDRKMLEELAASLEVGSRVEFKGFVRDRSRVRDLYWESDVFCLPSAMEARAIVALEAMSCGGAVVLTPVPAFKGLLRDGENGVLTPFANPEKLADAIRRAYRDRERLGALARVDIVEACSTKKFAERFRRDLLQETLEIESRAMLQTHSPE